MPPEADLAALLRDDASEHVSFFLTGIVVPPRQGIGLQALAENIGVLLLGIEHSAPAVGIDAAGLFDHRPNPAGVTDLLENPGFDAIDAVGHRSQSRWIAGWRALLFEFGRIDIMLRAKDEPTIFSVEDENEQALLIGKLHARIGFQDPSASEVAQTVRTAGHRHEMD